MFRLACQKRMQNGARMPKTISDVPTPMLTMGDAMCLPSAPSGALRDAVSVSAIISSLSNDSQQPQETLRQFTALRSALSVQTDAAAQEIMNVGGVTPLVKLMYSPCSAVQIEAAWVLTNIASGSSAHISELLKGGVVEAIFHTLASEQLTHNPDLCDLCLWTLGNIGGDEDVRFRDCLLSSNVVGILGQLYQRIPDYLWDSCGRNQVLRALTWLMSGLCHGTPAPPLDEVDCAFDYFVQVVCGSDDDQMLSEALWGLCYLIEGVDKSRQDARVTRMLSAGFAPTDVPEPPLPHPLIQQVVRCATNATDATNPKPIPATRLLGLMLHASGTHVTDMVLATSAMKELRCILVCDTIPEQMTSDAAWALSNVAAGTPDQALRLLHDSFTWGSVCSMLEHGPTQDVRRECAWALANMSKQGGSVPAQMDCQQALRLISSAFRLEPDHDLQRALVDAVHELLQEGDKQSAAKGLHGNPFTAGSKSCGLFTCLKELYEHSQESTCKKARYILKRWCDEDRENKPPQDYENESALSAICGGSSVRPAAFKFGA